MLPGVWSIDSLTSALREAADGLEMRARVPPVIHTCYQSCKKKKESLVGQAWMNHIKGAGKRQVVLGVTLVMLWARLTQSVATWGSRRVLCLFPTQNIGMFCIMAIIFIQAVFPPERISAHTQRDLTAESCRVLVPQWGLPSNGSNLYVTCLHSYIHYIIFSPVTADETYPQSTDGSL